MPALKCPFLGRMGKDLPLFSSLWTEGAWGRGVWGSMCGILYAYMPSLLTFEYKHAEVTKCRNPMKTILSSSSCLCFMDASLVAGPFRGWRTMPRGRREAVSGSGVLG